MRHNEITTICRNVVAETLDVSEDQIPVHPWDERIFAFADRLKLQNLTRRQIKEEFGKEVGQWLQQQRDMMAYALSTEQRHHDFYVSLYRQKGGKLNPEDMLNYESAMERERTGKVQPLPEEVEVGQEYYLDDNFVIARVRVIGIPKEFPDEPLVEIVECLKVKDPEQESAPGTRFNVATSELSRYLV